MLLAAAGDFFEVAEVFLAVDFFEVGLLDLFFRFGFAIGSVQFWVPYEARRHVRLTFNKKPIPTPQSTKNTLHS
jgi:hypothetical protein